MNIIKTMNWKIFLNLLIFFCFLTPAYSDLSTTEHGFPEPNPPFIELGIQEEKRPVPFRQYAPSQEWVYHKTSDNQHPDGNEQQMMWLMNRARSDPQAEGIWLSDTGDSDVDFALSFFDVSITVLLDEFASYDPEPPAAFDRRLYYAAKAHSDYLISIDDQNHDGQFDLITDEGFSYRSCGGNVYSYAKTPLYGHAGFNIDWGYESDGMQTGRGHRVNLMSIERNFFNVGKAIVQESDNGTQVGPLVVTENYCEAYTSYQEHYNNFIVGTVWADSNGNSQYDPGEGESGVTVTPDSGTYYAVTADSGGYAIPVTSQSISTVTFSGTSLGTDINKSVSVGTESVLLDVETGSEGTGTCTYSISSTSNSFDFNSGTGSVSVTATIGCSWTATSNNSWITIDSGSSGSGDGTVNYSVLENTSSTSSRTGTMTIAEETFTVTQDGLTSSTSGDWNTKIIDSTGDVGGATSIDIDSDNKAHISYIDYTNYDLKYATNVSGTWNTSIIDSGGPISSLTSLSIDSNNKVHISYYDNNFGLKYATNASGSWVISTIDNTSYQVGLYSSIAIDPDNKSHISYWDATNAGLKYATNTSGSWVTSTIDTGSSPGGVGYWTSIAIDTNNKVHISYGDNNNKDLKYATNTSGSWVTSTIDTSFVDGTTSIAIDLNNKVHISYGNGELKYASNTSGSWIVSTIDNSGSNSYSSIVIDLNNKAHIGYCDNSIGDLEYTTNESGSWVTFKVDDLDVVWTSSIAIDSDDNLYISYYDATNGDLKYANNISTGSPDISISPASHDFGSVEVGDTSTTQTFIISNTGTADLVIGAIPITGTNDSEFNIQNDNCSGQTIESSGTCAFETVFSPTIEGPMSASISIPSDDPDTSVLEVPLSGTGDCSYSISPISQSFDSGGGSNSVSVTTYDGCDWTAASNVSWVTIDSGSSDTGSGTVSYTVSANTSISLRAGTITIVEQTFMVIQAGIDCIYSISPTSNSFDSNRGTGSVSVTSESGCTWTATSNNSWITIDFGSSGDGDGTVNYSVSKSTSSRTGTIIIAGEIFTVTQSASIPVTVDPIPGIKANDSEETLDINEGDQLTIAISFDPGSYTGTSADWYIVVNTPSGWQSFNISQMDYSTSGLSALLQNYGLISLGSTGIFSTSSLSAGTYTYYFAVDLSGQFYYDSVTVTVEEREVSTPTGFTASVSGSTLTLSWNAVSGADGYKLYYGLSSGDYLGSLDLGNTTGQSFSGIPDGTYYFAITAYAGSNKSSYSDEVSITVESIVNGTYNLPDTGQTESYTNTFGEDSDYTIKPPSYTDNGDSTVTDNVTGLMWQQEDDDIERTWDDAVSYCDNLSLASYSDWRLPEVKELADIVNYGSYDPAIDEVYFLSTKQNSYYWSYSTNVGFADNDYAMSLYFTRGDVSSGKKSRDSRPARCVRGEQYPNRSFTDNRDKTVADNVTGLMWQQEDDNIERTWGAAITYCEDLSLAGYSDWKLPNIKELKSIIDYNKDTALDETYFPNNDSEYYWSSTTYVGFADKDWAWGVHLYFKNTSYYNKSETSEYVRCVR